MSINKRRFDATAKVLWFVSQIVLCLTRKMINQDRHVLQVLDILPLQIA